MSQIEEFQQIVDDKVENDEIIDHSENIKVDEIQSNLSPTQLEILITQVQKVTPQPSSFLDKKVMEPYNVLRGQIEDLNKNVTDLLRRNQQDFLFAYQDQMTQIQKELKNLQKKMDEETLKQKADDRLNILEEERDYFRAQAYRLDQLCKQQARDIQEYKFKQKILIQDQNYFQGFVIETKKENKALKTQLLCLYKNQMDTDKKKIQFQSKDDIDDVEQNFMENDDFENKDLLFDKNRETTQAFRPFSPDDQNLKKSHVFNRTENDFLKKSGDFKESSLFTTQVNLPQNQFGRAISHQIQNRQSNHRVQFNNLYGNQQMDQFAQSEVQYLETIKNLRGLLEKLKGKNQKLKAELGSQTQTQTDLQEILLDCIKEVQSDIAQRKANAQDLNQNSSSKGFFSNYDMDIDYSQFTHQDKVDILQKFITTDQFLDQIYLLTFGTSQFSTAAQGGPDDQVNSPKNFGTSSNFKLSKTWKQNSNQATDIYQNFMMNRYTFSSATVGQYNLKKNTINTSAFQFTPDTVGKINNIKEIPPPQTYEIRRTNTSSLQFLKQN